MNYESCTVCREHNAQLNATIIIFLIFLDSKVEMLKMYSLQQNYISIYNKPNEERLAILKYCPK